MSDTTRTPKLGEVWTDLEDSMTCTDEVPDDGGNYGWSWVRDGLTIKAYLTLDEMSPPKAQLPGWVARHPWVPVATHGWVSTYPYAKPSDCNRIPHVVGAFNVLTGEWVPR